MALVLAFIALMGIIYTSMVSKIASQHKEARSLQQQLVNNSVKYGALQLLANSESCLCQFSAHPIDTTQTQQQTFTLSHFKKGCGSDAFVSPGQEFGYGMKVDTIAVRHIVQQGGTKEYHGDLFITYNYEQPLLVHIPLQFIIDDTQGQPQARPLLSCYPRLQPRAYAPLWRSPGRSP